DLLAADGGHHCVRSELRLGGSSGGRRFCFVASGEKSQGGNGGRCGEKAKSHGETIFVARYPTRKCICRKGEPCSPVGLSSVPSVGGPRARGPPPGQGGGDPTFPRHAFGRGRQRSAPDWRGPCGPACN